MPTYDCAAIADKILIAIENNLGMLKEDFKVKVLIPLLQKELIEN